MSIIFIPPLSLSGPAMVWWYRFLNSKINWINQPLTTLTARVAADQLIFAPTFIGLFFINQGLMAGKSTNEIQKKLIE